MIMLFAFSGTAIAGFSTNGTQLSVKVGTTSHETSADVTGVSTVAAELNASSHHLYHVTI
jgi:hypothetical protein